MIQCQFENGRQTFLRHVVVDAIAVKNNKILLIKRAINLVQGGKYAFPGGFLDRDETTSQAVLREFLEETGYQGKIISLFRIKDVPNRRDFPSSKEKERQNVGFFFIVEIGKKIQEADNESSEVKMFDLDNLPSESEFAFDHYENIQLYLKHLQKPFSLPMFGK